MAVWHFISAEYPPQLGGVSDFVYLLAGRLAQAGDDVHVWCPPADALTPEMPGVVVHRELGAFTPSDLRHAGELLDRFPAPRRLFVQWVPHGFGYKSMNVGFCLWLWGRARRGDDVDILVHEAFHAFGEGNWRQNVAAIVHRVMTVILLRAARRVYYTIPAWRERWRPYALGAFPPGGQIPISSNARLESDPARTAAIRAASSPDGAPLVGHLGTFGTAVTQLLAPILAELATDERAPRILLIGPGDALFRDALVRQTPALAGRITVTGPLPADRLAEYLCACDVLVQPYIDGVSSRRTSFMAGLALGVPTVTTLGHLSEPDWSSTGAAAFVPVHDAAAFARTVRHLLADPDARRRMSTAATALYRERFDLEHVVATLRGE